MRRFLFLLPPVMAMWLACMQTAPGENSCDDVRIGGNSVGCGNPTKAIALEEMVAIGCSSTGCVGHVPGMSLKQAFHTEIVRGKLRITLGPISDSAQAAFGSGGNIQVSTRLFNQNPLIDTSSLGGKYFFGNKVLDLDYNYFCSQLDVPDKACSSGNIDTVDLMLEISRDPILVEKDYWYSASSYIGPVRLVVGDSNLSLNPSVIQPDTLDKASESLSLQIDIPPEKNASEKCKWFTYIPGTKLWAASFCLNEGGFYLAPLPRQGHRFFLASYPVANSNSQVMIYSLRGTTDPINLNPNVKMEIGDLLYTLPKSVFDSSMVDAVLCP